jgi:two-component system alkaline phosphatase synthesis response regulator PhoP
MKDRDMDTVKILIVDDDRDMVDTTRCFLETKGYVVQVAYDPDQGFTRLEEEVPDLAILDVMMGRGAGGIVLARKIRKEARFDHMAIIMLTGVREQTGFSFPSADPTHPEFLPVDEFLEKPIALPALLEKIEQQLAKISGK